MYKTGMLKEDALKGKTILITGGGTGLGKSMGSYFMELGANLIITSRKQAVLDETAQEFKKKYSGEILALSGDVRKIEDVENVNRSYYGVVMVYFDSNWQMDTCISLRTGLVKNNKLYIQAGGGVVFDSDPEKEYQETINKANALIAAAKDSYKYK